MADDNRTEGAAGDEALPRLGYLLKHAHLGYIRLTDERFTDLGVTTQEWAALNCLDAQPGRSQREVADLLGIDRTSMVALVDRLQSEGLVSREPSPADRRKNAVVLTRSGRDTLRRGARVMDACEKRYLAALEGAESLALRRALNAVIDAHR